LSYDDDFRDLFDDFDIFGLVKKSQNDMEKLLKKIQRGEMKGNWEIRQIDEPNMKGYAIRGSFSTEGPLQPLEPLEPIEPMKPSKRKHLPEMPFEANKTTLKEMREPLVDIFDEKSQVRVYVELPGVEKEDIKLNFAGNRVEVKARNFYKEISLVNENMRTNETATEYKNGVLEIVIPKEKKLRGEDSEKLRAV